MAYNLLMVDDEAEIVNWMMTMLNEEKIPDLEVYGAFSAEQALRILESMKIDIVISDIKMPGMNGIELMEKIKSFWPLCRIIFLTGYNEFDYVYTAIKHDGVRYLLKNEKDEIIIGAVKESINDIESSLKDSEIKSNAAQYLHKMLPLLQNEFFQDLVSGFYDSAQLTQERLDELGLPLKADYPCIMIIGRFDGMAQIKSVSMKDRNIYSVKHIAEKFLSPAFLTVCFKDADSSLIWIVQTGPSNQIDSKTNSRVLLEGFLEYIQASVKNSLSLSMSFTVSNESFPLVMAPEIYDGLKVSLIYHIGLANEIILCRRTYVSDQAMDFKEDKGIRASLKEMGKLRILENYIESGEKNECLTLLTKMLEALRTVRSRNSNTALEIYYSVSLVFLKIINSWNITEKIAFKVGLHKLTRIDEHKSWGEAVDYLYRVADAIFDIQGEEKTKRAHDTVTRVKMFICENIGSDLTLKRLSDLVGVNQSYLSRLFKQEIGSNLTEFIDEMRIEKAKNLLRFSSKKINEISVEVGYDSNNSFGRFFRNEVGLSPQEYRKSANSTFQ